MKKRILAGIFFLLLLSGCGKTDIPMQTEETANTEGSSIESIPKYPESIPTSQTEPEESAPEPADGDMVSVADYVPDILVELKYATTENFTGREIYGFSNVYLRYGTVKKLAQVQKDLASQGLRLKIWDGFRPVSAQLLLWEAYPDPQYVSNPNVGFSSHSRGNTVDVTLTDSQGREQIMPTDFDDFTVQADRDYSDCTEEAARNAMLLQQAMEDNGFIGYAREWWHFSDSTEYPVEKYFDPTLISRWYANCQEYITLRKQPDITAEEITRIPVLEEVTLCGYAGDFAMVDYYGHRGYVLASYLSPVEATVEETREHLSAMGPARYRAVCENFINLRTEPDVSAQVITQIPAGETFLLLQWCENFALVDYNGTFGYVAVSYIDPI